MSTFPRDYRKTGTPDRPAGARATIPGSHAGRTAIGIIALPIGPFTSPQRIRQASERPVALYGEIYDSRTGCTFHY